MRKFFFFTLFLGLFSNGISQSFVALPSDSISAFIDPNEDKALFIYFENISSQSISLQYQEVVANYPPGWFVQICDNNACFAMPHPQGSTWYFLPGDSSFISIHVFPLGIPGVGHFCYDLTDSVAGYTTRICFSFDARLVSNMLQAEENDLQISPNPAHSRIQLVSNAHLLQKGVVEIINGHGLVMKKVDIHAGSNQDLDVSDLPVGIYQLVYSTGTERTSRKVVVAR